MSSGPNLSLSTPIPSSNFLGLLSWRLPSLRNTWPTSRPETRAQHISWSQGRSISRSPPRRPWLVTGAFFLSSLSTYFSDVVHYSGTECSSSLLSFTSVPPDSVLDTLLMNILLDLTLCGELNFALSCKCSDRRLCYHFYKKALGSRCFP